MHRVRDVLALLALAAACGEDDPRAPADTRIDVVTFNVLFDFPDPEHDGWSLRGEHVAAILARADPDLIGLQEPLPHQVDQLHDLLPGYADARLELNTDSTLFYRETRFEKVDEGAFWLSPTPDAPWSLGFGNGLPRNVVWARLLDRETGRDLHLVNTHFDNTSPFQERAAPLLLERIAPLADETPLVVTGDFNTKPSSVAYGILASGDPVRLQNAFDLAPTFEVREDTLGLPSGERPYDPDLRIDHVWTGPRAWEVERWFVDTSRYGSPPRDPSDHFAIGATLRLPEASS